MEEQKEMQYVCFKTLDMFYGIDVSDLLSPPTELEDQAVLTWDSLPPIPAAFKADLPAFCMQLVEFDSNFYLLGGLQNRPIAKSRFGPPSFKTFQLHLEEDNEKQKQKQLTFKEVDSISKPPMCYAKMVFDYEKIKGDYYFIQFDPMMPQVCSQKIKPVFFLNCSGVFVDLLWVYFRLTPDDSNMMVVREQTPSEALAIVPIQFFVPASQQTTTDADSEPTPMLQIEGARETTPETPKQHQETTPKLPPAPTKIHPDAEDAAALLMMARTASYVPKIDLPMPSFSLGLTDSSQEGASTQETEREKSPEAATMLEQLDSLVQKLASSASKGKDESPQIRRETGGESSPKFETPGGINQIPDDMKEKCYIWGTRLKEDAKGDTNEFEEICTLTGQGEYILMRTHLASLQANSDIESQSMALLDHPRGEFISPKTNREFRVETYPSFIPFIDRRKLSSHPYIFAPVCHSGHWWLWLINTRTRKCQILDPLHKKAPSDERKDINKFTGYVFSRLLTYAGGKPLEKGEKEKEIKAPYVKISGQKTSYDYAIYVMKWLELIEPENIKKGKYEWDNWTQEEVDHYRVEYASRILFSELNTQRDRAIREGSAIRLSKPSSVLLSPFCQINSEDIENG
ncbi:hypothetical protein Ahy_A02g005137 [Arachis hypogaea]|uniref:Ubiquitin-like protease family profile domain-containing protein n=1 Tax=Arachis hypogaea TaxID=3818 RepID=A0A445E6A4_ARAHY|nr:hypothetical protein Ahy_A02g005137 [Arachis hypogaea]